MRQIKTIKIERIDAPKLKSPKKPFDVKEFLKLARKIKEGVRREEQQTYARFQTA